MLEDGNVTWRREVEDYGEILEKFEKAKGMSANDLNEVEIYRPFNLGSNGKGWWRRQGGLKSRMVVRVLIKNGRHSWTFWRESLHA